MIIRPDKTYETNSLFPDSNWYADQTTNMVVDETTPEGRALAAAYAMAWPYVEPVIVDGIVVDVKNIRVKITCPEQATSGSDIDVQITNAGSDTTATIRVTTMDEYGRLVTTETPVELTAGEGMVVLNFTNTGTYHLEVITANHGTAIATVVIV